jgi:CheY-like chemotaxis protein
VKLAIVEDEVILTMALTLMLEGWGHEVVGTADAEASAVAMVAAARPDAVLMDIRLGQQECGLNAARIIRRDIDVPIIFCTAYAASDALQGEVRALGNAHLVGKPVDEEQLEGLLRSIEQRARDEAPAASRLATPVDLS